ncbi:MAG: hypothetical protein ACLFQ9_03500 [Desulfobacterales bacterium]
MFLKYKAREKWYEAGSVRANGCDPAGNCEPVTRFNAAVKTDVFRIMNRVGIASSGKSSD